jgi:23S rRNA-intervening sequence protein
MKNYKELQVWQKSKRLTIELYKATEAFPRTEQFGPDKPNSAKGRVGNGQHSGRLGEGLNARICSVPPQCTRFVNGPDTHLIIADELNYLQPGRAAGFQAQIESVGQMLSRLIQALRTRRPTPRTTSVPMSGNESRTPNAEPRNP